MFFIYYYFGLIHLNFSFSNFSTSTYFFLFQFVAYETFLRFFKFKFDFHLIFIYFISALFQLLKGDDTKL